jgi:hypothetical protein
MLHALKTETGYFDLILDGTKTFEVRRHDRPFKPEDDICLQEWNPETKTYTGNEWHGKITYMLDNERFCKKGFVILGIKPKEQ